MKLGVFRYFLTVAREGSMTAAEEGRASGIKVEWNLAKEKAEEVSSAFCLYFIIFFV
jgi:hypothetical protein